MARRVDKEKVIKLRLAGLSYGQIKEQTGISKGTLSEWLKPFPLSPDQIQKIKRQNYRKIERFRTTMQGKRDDRLLKTYDLVKKDIQSLNKRELFFAGLFLYWGEGNKTRSPGLSNTDPAMLRFFIAWLESLGISKDFMKVRLQLYSDMCIEDELNYWSNQLDIPLKSFRQPSIKKSNLNGLSYKNGFGHGTCCIIFERLYLLEYILMGIKYIKRLY